MLILLVAALIASSLTDLPREVRGEEPKRIPWRQTILDGESALILPGRNEIPWFVGVDRFGPRFEPVNVAGNVIAKEFLSLCVATDFDETRLAIAARSSSFGLAGRRFSISDVNGRTGLSLETTVWMSSKARVQLWLPGNKIAATRALFHRQLVIGMGSSAMISSDGFTDSGPPRLACGFTMMLTNFRDPTSLVEGLQAGLGAQPNRVSYERKRRDNFGYWLIPSRDGSSLRIDYGLLDLNRPEPSLYLSARRFPSKR